MRIFLLLLLVSQTLTSLAQSYTDWSYWEFNAGLAHFPYDTFVFPGCSFLIGRQTTFGKSGFLDQQIGLAFPSIVTGKIGFGSKSENGSIRAGVRLFPGFAYV